VEGFGLDGGEYLSLCLSLSCSSEWWRRGLILGGGWAVKKLSGGGTNLKGAAILSSKGGLGRNNLVCSIIKFSYFVLLLSLLSPLASGDMIRDSKFPMSQHVVSYVWQRSRSEEEVDLNKFD
jgi:hypothetical protein